jgi:hypothetical protein
LIYVYREVNYHGGGRTHLLQLDGRTLGRLTQENYFRVEVWPGNYHLNFHLPSETLFGQTSAPMSMGQPLIFTHQDAGKAYIYTYSRMEGSIWAGYPRAGRWGRGC